MTHLHREALGRDWVRWSSQTGEVELWMPPGRVVLERVRGHVPVELADAAMRRLTSRYLRADRMVLFADWSEITGWDKEVHRRVMAWRADNRGSYEATHFLIRSPILAMTLSVLTLVVGRNVHVHSERDDFDALLAAAMRAEGLDALPRGWTARPPSIRA